MWLLILTVALTLPADPLCEVNPPEPVQDTVPCPQLDYNQGCQVSKRLGLPLVTFVGIPAVPVEGAMVCSEPALAGFKKGAIVVSRWQGDDHWQLKVCSQPQEVGLFLAPPPPVLFQRSPDCPDGRCPLRR